MESSISKRSCKESLLEANPENAQGREQTEAKATSAEAIIRNALKDGRDRLLAPEALELCRQYDIPIAEWQFAEDAEEAAKLSKKIGFPVAMKIVSPNLVQKSEAEGVALGLRNSREAKTRFTKLKDSFKGSGKRAFLGVLIQEQVDPGFEAIVGSFHDPQFGACVMLGLGGVFAELAPEVTFRLIPTEKEDAASMLSEVVGGRLFTGFRGHPRVDKETLIRTILSVSKMMTDLDELSSLELNPVILHEDRGVVVDAKAYLKKVT